ncbi:MAG: NAD(P)-dependent oxidoreductase [Dehalococcoidia bacterium]
MSLIVELQARFGRALVVGGGQVALRKARSLVEAGFEVGVVAPELEPALAELSVEVERRRFRASDLNGCALVLACTNDRALNREIGESARLRGILVLVADAQEESTFFMPAARREGTVAMAISTGGADPAAGAAIRDDLAEAFREAVARRKPATTRRPR